MFLILLITHTVISQMETPKTVSSWETHNCRDFQWKHKAISQAWTANKNHCKSGTTGENCLVHRAVTSNSTPTEITSAVDASQRNKAALLALRRSYTS